MEPGQAYIISVDSPIIVYGKKFQGDYKDSPRYIQQLHDELDQHAVSFVRNKSFGVYYDNPQHKKPEELLSFQGVFIQKEADNLTSSFDKIVLQGKLLYVKIIGDPMKAIYDGYTALFTFIGKNNIRLKSPAGYQVSTFENNTITTEIYMQPE